MELAKALDVRKGVTAIIGAGGKTTLLLALGRGMAAMLRGPVCLGALQKEWITC